jgi:hypothetical protein
MSGKQVEFLVKLRDAAQMMADATNEYLESLAPPGVKEEKQSWNWDPQKIPWLKVEGSRGAYERYPAQDKRPEATPDYKNMLQALKEHSKNFLFRDGYNYWLFQDAATIGRKPKQA